jgi:alpha-N-arabinofuranosidase
MRLVDPTIELAACGSSHRGMPTYAAWEYEVLDHCFDEVDFISLHTYFRNDTGDIRDYFTVIEDLDAFIREVAAIGDAVAAKRRSAKRIMLSLDEWNVWYKAHTPDDLRKPGWPQAPKLIEEIYNFEDALIVGGALITMINNADRVKAACLAQLVNVIGPIMTETGGPAWRQAIFHPFAEASRFARGEVLRAKIECERFATERHEDLPYLLAAVVYDERRDSVTILALNRHETDELQLELELRGFGDKRKVSAGGAERRPHRRQGARRHAEAAVVERHRSLGG